jgi:hypothetical protein
MSTLFKDIAYGLTRGFGIYFFQYDGLNNSAMERFDATKFSR